MMLNLFLKLQYVAIIFMLHSTTIRCDESLVDLSGDSIPNTNNVNSNNSPADLERQVIFHNKFDHTVNVMWTDTADIYSDYINIVTLEAFKTGDINTYNGHLFHIFNENDSDFEDLLAEIQITPFKSKYIFGDSEYSTTKDSESSTSTNSILGTVDYVKPLDEPISTAAAIQVRSLYPREINMWYDGGSSGGGGAIPHGHLKTGQETTVNSYEGHNFFFTEMNDDNFRISSITVSKKQVLYFIRPKNAKDEALVPKELFEEADLQEQFQKEYLERTGIQYRHYFGNGRPRDPPVLHMHDAEYIGQIHHIHSDESYWHCNGTARKCQYDDSLDIELEVLALKPRVFVIENFLSEFEADMIIELGRPRKAQSIVGDVETGAFVSNTRTSKNAWVGRHTNEVTETIYRRAADILGVDESILKHDVNAEQLQIVHYLPGQKYDAHHDWGVNGVPQSRFITLLLYLTDMLHENAGGETSFPKGGENGEGFKVHPGRGNAILFYNLLEDGNGDDLALHAALPVIEGEKWLANLWVWDPHF